MTLYTAQPWSTLKWRYAGNNREKRIAINHIENAAKLGHQSALREYSEYLLKSGGQEKANLQVSLMCQVKV